MAPLPHEKGAVSVGTSFLPQAARFLLAATLVACLYANGWPQQSTVPLTGTISDPTGAAVPSATVEAMNQDTGVSSTTRSNASGQFSFILPPGRYTVVTTMAGFRVLRLTDVPVFVGQANRLAIILSPGEVATTILVSPQQKRITGRSFLVGAERERGGYGLYSYLLLGMRPLNDDMRQRFLAVIDAYLRALSDVNALAARVPRARLNITYILVLEKPREGIPDASWVLNHYNFDRAKILLSVLPGPEHNGPYIISTLKPLSHQPRVPGHYLYQDMSDVPPSMAGLWEQQFEIQAEKPNFWKADTRSQAVLKLRTLIANAALALPDVKYSAAEIGALLGLRIRWH
jgi:Carboxypeptidase regulatory-like domain